MQGKTQKREETHTEAERGRDREKTGGTAGPERTLGSRLVYGQGGKRKRSSSRPSNRVSIDNMPVLSLSLSLSLSL